MVVYLKITANTKEVVDELNTIKAKIPKLSNMMVRKAAEIMRDSLRKSVSETRFTHSTGYLKTHINIKPGKARGRRNLYYVTMPYYAWAVERGRMPGKWPPPPHGRVRGGVKLANWARSAGLPWRALRRSIGEKGTRPRPFMRRGITMGVKQIRSEMEKMLKKSTKKK